MKTTTKTMLPNKKVAIILARVSSDAQVEGLMEQIDACEKYAVQNDIEVIRHITIIGGVGDMEDYEKHYKLLFEEKARHPEINTVLVSGYDRLARAGVMSIVMKALLQAKGINVVSTAQGVMEKSSAEELMEEMLCLYSHLENSICNIDNNSLQ